jgi:translation initiation factor IF-2
VIAMTDSENRDKKPKVLGLKGGTNTVRQSFSHGRSKSVVVETRKKKLLISKKSPVAEDNDKNNLSKIETNENEEILRRRKAIEASKVEEKKLQEQTKENKKIQEKELKPIEVKDKVKIPDTFSLETQDLNESKKKTKKREYSENFF